MAAKRIVVVGAGPGGLATAMQLARAGCHVTLLERRSSVGGRTSSIQHNGFRFDCGPTFFLYPRVLAEIFRSIGRDLLNEVPMVRLDPQYRLTFGAGGSLDCTSDLDRMESQIAALSPSDEGNLKRYLDDNRTKLARFRPILESPFCRPRDLCRPAFVPALKHLRPWRSLAGELGRYFSDPRLVIAFGFQSKYLGMSPFQCPSLFSILSFLEYEYGVWHPIGGCSRVCERMAELAREMGVEIRLSEPVTKVQWQGRRATAVTTHRDTYPCDAMVVNADFAHWMTTTVPDSLRRRWSDDRIEKKRFSCSTFMLYLAIKGKYDRVPHHNIHISQDYEKNLHEIEASHQLSDDPSFYVQNASVTDETLAPAGHSALYVLVPVTHQHENVTWSIQGDAFRDKTIANLAKIGMPDVADRIVWEHRITPDDWQSQYSVYRGATFNLAHQLSQMLHNRPRNRFEELDGVYLVGGGTHPGSGLPVIFESTRITSRLLLRDLGMDSSFMDQAMGSGDDFAARARDQSVMRISLNQT